MKYFTRVANAHHFDTFSTMKKSYEKSLPVTLTKLTTSVLFSSVIWIWMLGIANTMLHENSAIPRAFNTDQMLRSKLYVGWWGWESCTKGVFYVSFTISVIQLKSRYKPFNLVTSKLEQITSIAVTNDDNEAVMPWNRIFLGVPKNVRGVSIPVTIGIR